MNKIVIITSEFPPLPGGIGNHAYMLAKYLQKENYEVSVLSDYRNVSKDNDFDKKQNFKIFRIKRNLITYVDRFFKAFLLMKKNEVIIASGKFSLWIIYFLKPFFSNKKYIAVLHGSELKAGNTWQQKFTQKSLLLFDEVIAVSNFTKKVALGIVPQLQIKVINNGIELTTQITSVKNVPNSEINLVTVGNLTFRKGQQNVIKVLPLLESKFKKIHYHCIGIPTEIDAFSALAKELNVFHNITFYGAVSNEEKNSIMKKCSIFIMLSDVVKNDFEGFGIAIVEANALGLPAIGSKTSGISDAIDNKTSGILVHPRNDVEVLSAVETIVENYSQYSSNAQSWAKKFDWNKIVQKYVAAINE